MVGQSTAKAKAMMTRAFHCRYDTHEIFGSDTTADGVDAVRCWTPLEIVLVVNISPREELLVPVGIC